MSRFKDIALVVLVCMTLFYILSLRKASNDLEATESVLKAKQANLITLMNDNGELIQQRQTAVTSKENIEKYYKEAIVDIKENHNIKLKNVKDYYRGKMQAKGSGKTIIKDSLITVNDTIMVYKAFNFNDQFLSLNGLIKKQELSIKYSYTDSLSFVSYIKKVGGLFSRKKESYVSIKTENPNSAFLNFENVKLSSEKVKKISAGLGLGIDLHGNVTPQLQVHYSLVRF